MTGKNEKIKNLAINSELHDELRAYCDSENIRFKDFVEDALENAIYRNEQAKVFDQANQLLSNIEKERKKAYWHGFDVGFFMAVFTLKGMNVNNETLKKSVEDNPIKIVKGRQLNLFE